MNDIILENMYSKNGIKSEIDLIKLEYKIIQFEKLNTSSDINSALNRFMKETIVPNCVNGDTSDEEYTSLVWTYASTLYSIMFLKNKYMNSYMILIIIKSKRS